MCVCVCVCVCVVNMTQRPLRCHLQTEQHQKNIHIGCAGPGRAEPKNCGSFHGADSCEIQAIHLQRGRRERIRGKCLCNSTLRDPGLGQTSTPSRDVIAFLPAQRAEGGGGGGRIKVIGRRGSDTGTHTHTHTHTQAHTHTPT